MNRSGFQAYVKDSSRLVDSYPFAPCFESCKPHLKIVAPERNGFKRGLTTDRCELFARPYCGESYLSAGNWPSKGVANDYRHDSQIRFRSGLLAKGEGSSQTSRNPEPRQKNQLFPFPFTQSFMSLSEIVFVFCASTVMPSQL